MKNRTVRPSCLPAHFFYVHILDLVTVRGVRFVCTKKKETLELETVCWQTDDDAAPSRPVSTKPPGLLMVYANARSSSLTASATLERSSTRTYSATLKKEVATIYVQGDDNCFFQRRCDIDNVDDDGDIYRVSRKRPCARRKGQKKPLRPATTTTQRSTP